MLTVTTTSPNMFRPVPGDLIRLTTEGVAVKTNNGYKVYNHETGVVTNCSDFVLDTNMSLFFYVPANSVSVGDIVLFSGKLVTITNVNVNDSNRIEAFRYEDSTLTTLIPEKFMFLGDTYMFTKVMSIFGDVKDGIDTSKIMSMMLLNNIFNQNNSGNSNNNNNNNNFMSNLMTMGMVKNIDFKSLFSGLFDFNVEDKNSSSKAE